MNTADDDRPFFSFVIPAHDVSDSIERCLDSILTQSYRSLEVIVVDDASSDETPDIVKRCAERDDRVRLISFDENKTAHCARYDGVMACVGSYVWMVDGDDEISPGACEEIRGILAENPVDVLQFGTEIVNDGNLPAARIESMRKFVRPHPGQLGGRDVFEECFVKKSYRFNIWNKVFSGPVCKKAFAAMSYRPIPKAQDEYEYFALSFHADSYLGIPDREFYRYHYGSGFGGHNTVTLEQFERYCVMDLALSEMKGFAEREAVDGEYSQALDDIESQLFDNCYSNWANSLQWTLRGAGMDLMMGHWSGSRVIGTVAKKNWSKQGEVARLLSSSKTMSSRPSRRVETVALFCQTLNKAETQREVAGMTEAWLSIGLKVVLVDDRPPSDSEVAVPEGVARETVPPAAKATRENYAERCAAISRVLGEHSVDAVVYHSWASPLLLWDLMTCKSCGTAFVPYCNSTFSTPVRSLRANFASFPDVYRLCDAVIVLGESDGRFWSCFNPNVHCIPCAVPSGQLPREQSDPESKTILWAGGSEEGRPVEALKVMVKVIGEVPDARIAMVGGNKEARKSVMKSADQLGIRDSVEVYGSSTDRRPLYERSSVFLCTSDYGEYPTGIAEALSAGLPVVSYDLPYDAVVRDGTAVVRVPQMDSTSAARETARFLLEGDYRDEMCRRANEMAEKLRSFESADSWKSVFDSLEDEHAIATQESPDRIMWDVLMNSYLAGVAEGNSKIEGLSKKLAALEARAVSMEDEIRASVAPSSERRTSPAVTIFVKLKGGYECTLDSVVGQTFQSWKCVAISDADPAALLALYGAHGISVEKDMKSAVRHAKTPYIIVMDSEVELDSRFLGMALSRLGDSSRPSMAFTAPGSDRSGRLTVEQTNGRVIVAIAGTTDFKAVRAVPTALVSEVSGIPRGAPRGHCLEPAVEVSFLFDCRGCGCSAAEPFLKSMPDWGELVCYDAPEDDSLRGLVKKRWWDGRLKVLKSSGHRTPLFAVAGCCRGPSLIRVDPSSHEYGKSFFEAALAASRHGGRIVPDDRAVAESVRSVKADGFAFDPLSTVLRRSEVVQGGFCHVSDALSTYAVAGYSGLPVPKNAGNANADCTLYDRQALEATAFGIAASRSAHGTPSANDVDGILGTLEGRLGIPDAETCYGTDPGPSIRRVCPVCGGVHEHMLPAGTRPREEAECPECGSMERHRAIELVMKNTLQWISVRPKTLYVDAPGRMIPYLRARGADCIRFEKIAEVSWSFDAIILCHRINKMERGEALDVIRSRLSKTGRAYITVPLVKVNGRTNMIDGLGIDVFELMDEISSHGFKPELHWAREALSPVTAEIYSLGDEAVIECMVSEI